MFSFPFYLFFLWIFFLLLKKIIVLKMYLLVNLLTPKGFEKISLTEIIIFLHCWQDGLGGCRILPCSHKVHKDCANAMKPNRYRRKILTKTVRSVTLNTTGERENDPANQTVEKKGVQADTGDMGKAKEALKQPIQVTETQRERNPSNETTVEAERQPMATLIQESPRPVCSHFLRRCLVRFPCCGKFFPCHRCHNESADCTEGHAKAIDATHIRCTICYNEQVVRFYLRTEYKFSSLSFSKTRHTATSQSSCRCCQMVMLNEILSIECLSDFLSLICMTFSMHFRSMKIARDAASANRKCLNISVHHVNNLLL